MQPFIGSKIKYYRTISGMTQEELSVRLDITKQHLGLIERGISNPSMDVLQKVCRALLISPASLFLGWIYSEDSWPSNNNTFNNNVHQLNSSGVWVVNLINNDISWSKSFYKLIGESKRIIPSLNRFMIYVETGCKDGFMRFYKNVLLLKKEHIFIFELVRKNGMKRSVQVIGDIASIENSKFELALFNFIDITDLQILHQTQLKNQLDLENIVQEKTKSLRLAADELTNELELRTNVEHQLREKSNALAESEANFRSFFETVDDIILVADERGMILHANPAAVSKTRYSLAELKGMNILDLHETGKRQAAKEILAGMMRRECSCCDLPIITKDGRAIPVESRIWLGKWNGCPCVYGISKEQLRISSTLLRLICDNVPDMIWAKDMQKRFIFANTTICRDMLSAEDTEEPIGKTDLYFAERIRSRFAEISDYHTFGELCQDTDQITMDAKSPQQFDEFGNVKGQFKRLEVHKAPLYDDQGIMIGTVGSAREVTEQRRIASALETSNKAFLTILDNMSADVCVTDIATNKILFVNQKMKASFGRDCTGENCHVVFRDSKGPCLSCRSSDLLDHEGNPTGTVTWENFNPVSRKWYMNSDLAIAWIDGKMARVQIAIDITARKNAEDALRMERDLFSAGPVMTIVWEARSGWPVRFVSKNCLDILGYRPEELTAQSFLYESLIHPEDQSRVVDEMECHTRDMVGHTEQSYRLLSKSGQYIWIYDFTKFIRNREGEVTSACGYILDQSRMKEMERTLAEERERLAGIIDGTNVGTWEWNIETGKTQFNERWAEIIGYDLKEISPTSIQVWERLTHPDDLIKCYGLLEKHFDFQTSHYEAELRMRHKDGHWVWVLDRGKVSSWTPDGRPFVMHGTHQDITDRKTAEAELRRVNQLLQSIVEALPGYLNVVDQDYNILRSNMLKSENVHLGDKCHVGDGRCYEILRGRSSPCPWCMTKRVIASGKPHIEITTPGDPRQKTPNRTYQIHLNPVKDDRGNVFGVVEYSVDVTEYINQQNIALSTQKTSAALLATMSHEIRTPISMIMGMLELMHMTDLTPDQMHYVDKVTLCCELLARLFSDILDITRLEAGMLTIRNEPMNPGEVLAQIKDMFLPVASKQGVELKIAIDTAVPERILGDHDRLLQVLTNIVSNSLKFTRTGHILVEAFLLSSPSDFQCRILFCVTDTGIGIPKHILPSLCTHISELRKEHIIHYRETGLGLAICKYLVELMNGDITIQSEPESGTIVYLSIPFARILSSKFFLEEVNLLNCA